MTSDAGCMVFVQVRPSALVQESAQRVSSQVAGHNYIPEVTVRTAEQVALDELEDARAAVELYRGKLFWTVFALLASIGGVLVGSWFGQYGFGAALVVMGGFGIPASAFFGGVVIYTGNERGGKNHPAKLLRAAERKHRDAVMDDV